MLHRLDIVFAIPPGTIEVFVDHRGGGSAKRGDDTAWMIARGPGFRLAHAPPGSGPGLCSIDALVIEAATDGRRLARGLGEGDTLVRETPRRLEGGSGLAEQDGIASKPRHDLRYPS